MLSAILMFSGTALMVVFVLMVNAGNQNGWSFLLPAVLLLGLGGLCYDLSHRKPRRRSVEDEERPIRRKRKVRANY